MKLILLVLIPTLALPSLIAANALVSYRNKEYAVIGVNNDSVIINLNGKPKSARPQSARIVDDDTNRMEGVSLELKNLVVTLQPKGTRSLMIQADIESSANIDKGYLILVSGSGNDVSTVARALPPLAANNPSKIDLTIKTSKFTKREPYQLAFFSDGKSIPLKGGDPIVRNRIAPYDDFPRALFQVDSIFPDALKNQFSQAKVIMEFTIDPDGNATNIIAVESPHELFTENAAQSLERSRFVPRYVKGIPKATRTKQIFVFRNTLQDSQNENIPPQQ